MAQEFRSGEIVSQSGVYTITHDPVHADMPHEVTVIKGRRFPTCRHCKGITFQLSHAARWCPEGWCRSAGVLRSPAGLAG